MWILSIAFFLTVAFGGAQASSYREKDEFRYTRPICEGGKELIKCEHQKIYIVAASYGRYDRFGYLRYSHDTCKSGLDWMVSWKWNFNCHATNERDVVRRECQGLSECELHANNAEFGDPCPGTKKYLSVIYSCKGDITAGDTKMERICENEQMSLECPEKRSIDIVWANFGRLKGGHICGDGFFGAFSKNQECNNTENSLMIARDRCQGREYCTLEASVEKFGDACWGTTKYLEVRYRCCPKKRGCSE